MRNLVAVITGASSGLGQEFVRQLDEMTHIQEEPVEEPAPDKAPHTIQDYVKDVIREWKARPAHTNMDRPDEIWVLARRADRLEALQELTSIPVRAFPCDLTDKETIRAFRDVLAQEQPDIRMLINAAGYGKIGPTADMSLENIEGMVDLNCRAAISMTQICLPYMRSGARILEICSIAAFQPLTRLNVYAASKAFLYSYSRSLRAELQPRGIIVTAVCPYWVKDTEFIGTAEQGASAFEQETASEHEQERPLDRYLNRSNNEDIHSYPLAGHRDKVVRRALLDAELGLAVSTPGIISSVQRFLRKFLPSDLMILAWEGIRRI